KTAAPFPDGTPQTVPTGLVDSVISCSQINEAWVPSTDGGTGVGSYRVYRNNILTTTIAAPTTFVNDTNVAPSTGYTYQVSAVDNAGNESARSAGIGGSTPACVTTTTAAPTTTTHAPTTSTLSPTTPTPQPATTPPTPPAPT